MSAVAIAKMKKTADKMKAENSVEKITKTHKINCYENDFCCSRAISLFLSLSLALLFAYFGGSLKTMNDWKTPFAEKSNKERWTKKQKTVSQKSLTGERERKKERERERQWRWKEVCTIDSPSQVLNNRVLVERNRWKRFSVVSFKASRQKIHDSGPTTA